MYKVPEYYTTCYKFVIEKYNSTYSYFNGEKNKNKDIRNFVSF